MLASYVAQFTDVDEVWLMLSPLNPLKEHPADLVADHQRLDMLQIATRNTPCVKPCDIELSMPRPSYTIHSLNRLSELYPDTRFSLLIGSDNWLIFPRWYQWKEILEHFTPIIYPRPGYDIDPTTLPSGVTMVNAPTVDISSTFIRQSIAAGKDMNCFLPCGVYDYITQHNLYSCNHNQP